MHGLKSTHIRPGLDDVDVVLLVVVVEADAVALCQATEAAQRGLQHCLGITDVQEVLQELGEVMSCHSDCSAKLRPMTCFGNKQTFQDWMSRCIIRIADQQCLRALTQAIGLIGGKSGITPRCGAGASRRIPWAGLHC